MKRFLTPKEEKVLNFIEKYQFKHGASPTVKEMRLYMKLKSDGFIIHCLKRLVHKGAIKKGVTPRSVNLLPSVAARLHSDIVKIPVPDSIPAGDWISFSKGRIKNPKDCFVLRVKDDSMINAGISKGDFVIVNSRAAPKNGDIVAVLADNGSTVKRFVKNMQVKGVVIGLFRWYA
ncbi:hypothetical protein HZC21_03060 [Candidatus Peregrinibacteria bacterium]|nr:hypothetical protein [Candidatus Peregrinibacteria bacterium]